MNARLNLDSINGSYWAILVVSWLYFYLATERKCSSRLKCKRRIFNTNSFNIRFSHIYVELDLLKLKLGCLFNIKLPIKFSFCFCKW